MDKPGVEPGFARFRLYVSIVVLTSPIVFPASRLASRIIKLSVYQFRHLSLLKSALSSQTVHYTTTQIKNKTLHKSALPDSRYRIPFNPSVGLYIHTNSVMIFNLSTAAVLGSYHRHRLLIQFIILRLGYNAY